MAKKSAVERNLKRTLLVKKFASKRAALMVVAKDTSLTPEERFNARLKLAEIPRNSAAVRLRLRRKFKLSRIALRELASAGQIPGMVKSSW